MNRQQSFIQFNNQEKKETDFEIITLKNLSENQNKFPINLQKPHRVKHYSILVITTGIGYHYIDFKKYNFTKGTFIFPAMGQIQAYDFKPGNDGYILSFTEKFLTKTINRTETLSQTWLYNYHMISPKIQVKAGEQEHFFDITENIFKEYHAQNQFAKEEIIQSLLNLLLLKSERIKRIESSGPVKTDYILIFFKFKNLCEEKYFETRNAKFYAEILNISYKHLNNICKLCVNKTAKQFIDDFIVLESKRCLMSSEKSITDISEHTGFDEATNFVKYFKKHSGFSPERYRKKHF